MAFVLKDRVLETTTSTGTGTITLAGAVTGFQGFSVVGDGNTCYYTITGGAEWEVGVGTYTSSGTTLSRDSVLESSNSGNLVNFSAGTKNVFVTYPAELAVTLSDAQTLTNKTLTTPVLSGTASGTTAGRLGYSSGNLSYGNGSVQRTVVNTDEAQTLTNKTIEKAILNDGYTEEVFAITDGASVNLDPNNGSIQTWTLGASRTPGQTNWAAGQSITLMVDDGSAYTITWTTLAVTWKTDGGTAPTLNTTGFTAIALWKVGSVIYGARVGDA